MAARAQAGLFANLIVLPAANLLGTGLKVMPARVSETYVLRTYPFRESDLIVSFFKRDQGNSVVSPTGPEGQKTVLAPAWDGYRS